jgi:hypothetical protein
MEDPALTEDLEREALFGPARIFARGEGTGVSVIDGKLVLERDGRGSRSLNLDAQGGILIRQPVENERDGTYGMSVILVETVHERLAAALRYSAWLLDHLDPTQRLFHVVVAARIIGGFAMRTRREHDASPNSIQMSGFGQEERLSVRLTPPHVPRPALIHQADQIVEDLATLLRRQWH